MIVLEVPNGPTHGIHSAVWLVHVAWLGQELDEIVPLSEIQLHQLLHPELDDHALQRLVKELQYPPMVAASPVGSQVGFPTLHELLECVHPASAVLLAIIEPGPFVEARTCPLLEHTAFAWVTVRDDWFPASRLQVTPLQTYELQALALVDPAALSPKGQAVGVVAPAKQ